MSLTIAVLPGDSPVPYDRVLAQDTAKQKLLATSREGYEYQKEFLRSDGDFKGKPAVAWEYVERMDAQSEPMRITKFAFQVKKRNFEVGLYTPVGSCALYTDDFNKIITDMGFLEE